MCGKFLSGAISSLQLDSVSIKNRHCFHCEFELWALRKDPKLTTLLVVEANATISFYAVATEQSKNSCPLWKFMIKALESQKKDRGDCGPGSTGVFTHESSIYINVLNEKTPM